MQALTITGQSMQQPSSKGFFQHHAECKDITNTLVFLAWKCDGFACLTQILIMVEYCCTCLYLYFGFKIRFCMQYQYYDFCKCIV